MKILYKLFIALLLFNVIFIQQVYAEDTCGKITGSYIFDNEKFPNADVDLYLIATYDNNSKTFQFKKDFEDYELDINSLNQGELQEYSLTLKRFISNEKVNSKYTVKTNDKSQFSFDKCLEKGLYLINVKDIKKYNSIYNSLPSILTIPTFSKEEGKDIYEVNINVKSEKNKNPDICKVNCDTNGDGKPDVNIDTNGDGKPDINIDVDGDGKADINIDTTGDGKPDHNLSNQDTDGDGKCDINCDSNNDGNYDLNIDIDGDGKPDINIDTNGDGKPDINIDVDGDGKADINIDTTGDGKPDHNLSNQDTDGDGKCDINCDNDGDGKLDLNIDIDGDGVPDLNIDTDGDGKCDINCVINNGSNKPNDPDKDKDSGIKIPNTYDSIVIYVSILIVSLILLAVLIYYINRKKKGKK